MKTNSKKKLLVSTLALAMGAGLAGSISGSVAWYQYSTRTTAQLQGVSAGTTRNLQVRIKDGTYDETSGDWVQDLSAADLKAYVLSQIDAGTGKPTDLKLNPVTAQTANRANNTALATRNEGTEQAPNNVLDFRGHPVYQYGNLPKVGQIQGENAARTFNYIQIPLQFRVLDGTSTGTPANVEKEIYLVDANFAKDQSTEDITSALRLHISNGLSGDDAKNALLANTATSTAVSGALDLNKNGKMDKDAFTGEDTDEDAYIINYGNRGEGESKTAAPTAILSQASYNKASFLAKDQSTEDSSADAYHFVDGVVLGKTVTNPANDNAYLTLTLTIWLEGWSSELENETGTATGTSLWDDKYIGSDFKLQLRFACEADN